jgi:hypothetical protein
VKDKARKDLIRKLVAAEILAKRGEGPLALRLPPKRPPAR